MNNNRKIPFANLHDEMQALQARSEDYQGKIAALKITNHSENQGEINRLSQLDHECQSAIAFCFSRKTTAT